VAIEEASDMILIADPASDEQARPPLIVETLRGEGKGG